MKSGPTLTEADQRAAIARLRAQASEGRLTERRLRQLTAAVWASNTPHELYRKTSGLLGERHRKDAGDWWRIVAIYAAVCVAMFFVALLLTMAAKDGLLKQS